MKEAGVDLRLGIAGGYGAIDSEHHSVSSRRRRIGALVSSEEAIGKANVRRGKGKAYGICWATSEHAGAVKRVSAHAIEGGVVGKQVHRQEVGILSWAPAGVPHGHFGIVAKECRMCRIHLYRIEKPPAADGVGGWADPFSPEKKTPPPLTGLGVCDTPMHCQNELPGKDGKAKSLITQRSATGS